MDARSTGEIHLERRSPEIRKSTRGTRTPPLTVIARSPCDEAIQGPCAVAPGLLRCARNDGGVDATIIAHRLSSLIESLARMSPTPVPLRLDPKVKARLEEE